MMILAVLAFLMPLPLFAHEVYVLDEHTVSRAMTAEWTNPFSAYYGNEFQFYLWGFICLVAFSTILAASTFRWFQARLAPFFHAIKPFALPLVRITVSLSLISFGLYGSLFGPELPFDSLFGGATTLFKALFVIAGCCICIGLATRSIALLGIAIYAYAWSVFGWYMLTYTDHLGALVLLVILGSGSYSIGHRYNMLRLPHRFRIFLHRFSPYAFPLLRILFGFGVMFAAIYAKFLHSDLALQVVLQYNLTEYFPFEPLFIVLGALIIEFLAGLMIFLGIEIRWTGLFLIFWLTLSLLYFQEAVWPHIVLFGLGLALFCHGYDHYSIEGRFLRKADTEPVF